MACYHKLAESDAKFRQLTQKFSGEAEGIQGFFDEILGVIDEAIKPFDRDSWWDLIRIKAGWALRFMTMPLKAIRRQALQPSSC